MKGPDSRHNAGLRAELVDAMNEKIVGVIVTPK